MKGHPAEKPCQRCSHRPDDVDGAPAVHAVPLLAPAAQPARAGGTADAHRGHRAPRRHPRLDPPQSAAAGRDGALQPAGEEEGRAEDPVETPGGGEEED